MHLFFINLGLESTWNPPHNNGLCYIILDFALSMSSCCSLRCRHSPPSSCENDCKNIFQIWYEVILSFDMTIRHLPKYATIWNPSYVRFFCPPPKAGCQAAPLNTCDVFLNCEFCKSTSSIHVIIISHQTVPQLLKQLGLKVIQLQLYFSHNRSKTFPKYWAFFRRVIISGNQGDLLGNTNWSFLVLPLAGTNFYSFLLLLQNPFLYDL